MPKEFRENYEATKKERDELKAKASTLETKIKEWESKSKDTEALLARQKEYEAQIEAKNAELRALKQEASPEFKQKYDEPFNRRAEFARTQIEGKLQVITRPADPDTQSPAQYRAATWDDFVALYQMPPNKAVEQADQMFGEKVGSFVMNHITKLQEMDYERQAALKQEKEQYKARQAEEDSNRVKQRAEFDSTFKRVSEELAESVEGYKDADPTDKELADLRQEGFKIFDATPENPQQHILKGAHIRHRVAAYGPNMLTITRLKAKVSELEAKLAEATPKPPGDTLHPGGESTTVPTESWEDGALKAVRAAPAM